MSEPASGNLCIIPARGGSKRILRKNIAVVGGKPLLTYAIECALGSRLFVDVLVSSDDDEILKQAERDGARGISRPPELATDTAQYREVCIYHLEQCLSAGAVSKYFCVLIPNNPLRTSEDLRQAYGIMKSSDADLVMSLVEFDFPPQRSLQVVDGLVRPVWGEEFFVPSQKLEKLYRHDGLLVWGKIATFLENRSFYHGKIAPYVIPPERSVDIDSPLDLEWASFLLSRQSQIPEF